MWNALLGGIVPALVPLGFCEDSEKRRIAARHPAAKNKSADEDSYASEQTVEQVECTHGSNANKIEQRTLDAQIREGLVQALVYPFTSPVVGACVHR
jgi:hypothetical protein